MAELLRQYFRIAFLMGRPQDLPAGAAQLQIGLALAFVTYVLALLGENGLGRTLASVVLDLGLTALALRTALSLVGHPRRFEQAFGGLCGASAFVNTAAVPVYLGQPAEIGGAGSGTAAFAGFVLLVWSLSLLAHVLRHTFELRLGLSIVVAFVYFIVLVNVMDALLPPPAAEPAVTLAPSLVPSPSLALSPSPLLSSSQSPPPSGSGGTAVL